MKIDAHHHVWDMSVRPQDWMTDSMRATIEGPYDMRAWASVAHPAGVSRSIVVQTVPDAEETPELLALAEETESLAGVVGWLDVSATSFEKDLHELRSRPGARKLVGIRELAEYNPDPDWLTSPTIHRVATELEAAGLTFDLLILPHQLGASAELVHAHPGVRFVLDHLAKPSLHEPALHAWEGAVRDLARHENVACKISGYAVFDAPRPPSFDKLRPAFDIVLDAFGTRRLMFGSDWPVAELGASYQSVVSIAEDFAQQLTPAEQARFWAGTALEWYPNAIADDLP